MQIVGDLVHTKIVMCPVSNSKAYGRNGTITKWTLRLKVCFLCIKSYDNENRVIFRSKETFYCRIACYLQSSQVNTAANSSSQTESSTPRQSQWNHCSQISQDIQVTIPSSSLSSSSPQMPQRCSSPLSSLSSLDCSSVVFFFAAIFLPPRR